MAGQRRKAEIIRVESNNCLNECTGTEMIKSVSCLNLRGDHRGVVLRKNENIELVCTCCGKVKFLGKGSASLVRISFGDGDEVLCDKCSDILLEVGIYGPRVLSESYKWRLSSKVARVSSVFERMECGRCAVVRKSHVLFKYGEFVRVNRVDSKYLFRYVKLCSVCTAEILCWMRASSDVRQANRFLFKSSQPNLVYAGVVRA